MQLSQAQINKISKVLKNGLPELGLLASAIATARYDELEPTNGLLKSIETIQQQFFDMKIIFSVSEITRGFLNLKK